jgi:hypothetical protein
VLVVLGSLLPWVTATATYITRAPVRARLGRTTAEVPARSEGDRRLGLPSRTSRSSGTRVGPRSGISTPQTGSTVRTQVRIVVAAHRLGLAHAVGPSAREPGRPLVESNMVRNDVEPGWLPAPEEVRADAVAAGSGLGQYGRAAL